MHRLWWPGYNMQLLGELQKQQNSAQFCDTLLQTEGISVPTHSCVLAACSPYLSQKLSTSPSPPFGQKRQLQLREVTAQTLLKLVGLLYSGELEVKGDEEQNDVMAAAHQFGITGLVAGHQDGGRKKAALLDRSIGSFRENGFQKVEGRERCVKLKMQDAQIQVEMTEKRGNVCLETKKSVSKGTQTVKIGEMSVGNSAFLSHQKELPVPETVFSVERLSAPLQTENITLDKQFCLTPCPAIPSNDPSSPRSQEENISQQSPKSGDTMWMSTNESKEQEDESVDSGGHKEQLGQVSRDEISGGEKGNSEERRHLHVKTGMKNLAKMLQMETMKTTQFSVKVKLKRRTKGEMWEVVNLQGADEAFSVLTSLKQGCSNQEGPQMDLKDVQPPPKTQNSQPVNVVSPKTPVQSCSSFDSSSSGFITLNQSSELESLSLPQLLASVDETDEQIERWLEDIMMGLNILSNLDSNSEKQTTVTESGTGENNTHGVVGAPGYHFDQDLGTHSSHSSTGAGTHFCSGTQSQPTCTNLSPVPPDTLMQQRSQFFSSARFSGRSTGMSHGSPLSKSENSLCPEPAPARSVWSFPSSPSGQKLHYSALQQPSSLKDQTVLEIAPFSHENETQSEHTLRPALPWMDDLRLPQCLSPLEPYTVSGQDHLLSNSSANPENYIQKQPLLHRLPWLTETPVSLQFPLSAIIESQTAAPPQDANSRCKTPAECYVMNSVKEKELTELTSDPKKLKEGLSCKQHDATKDAAAPKRKRRRCIYFPQDGDVSLASKKSKVSNSRKTCVVSLSSKNVLVKERKKAASSSNKFSTSLEKTKEVSGITGTVSEKSRCPENSSTEQPRIRTRGFVRDQEKMGNIIREVSHVLPPVVCRPVGVNKQGGLLLKRKRGRPRKIKLEENLSNDAPTSAENRNHNEQDGGKTEDREQRREHTGAEEVLLKKTRSDHCFTKTEGDNNNNTKRLGTSKQSWMVTMKEFQKLIKRQHSNVLNGSQKTSEPAGDAEREDNAKGFDDVAMESGIDVGITENAKTQVQGFFSVTGDENYHQVFNTTAAHCSKTHPDDPNSSASGETSTLSHEDHPEVGKLSTEQLLKNPDEGAFGDFRTSDMMQSASRDEDASLNNSHLLQENVTLVPNSSPLIPEKSDPLAQRADVIKSISECSQEEEGEVDVLVFSPEKRPLTKEYEGDLNNMVLTPDEDEDDEMNEIDVTGDETE
ncbi:uncharacterized protein LOC121638037 [Melanotaenia boesemani]|uniref:uncharacterized protein LOC121638037 n=1 Tax=Melanotaenia boesemani TaxID=1250792 RepID=UPI001C04065C|nr:uncharacterized protein LOC121638037 [Melanotaenia boesemani]